MVYEGSNSGPFAAFVPGHYRHKFLVNPCQADDAYCMHYSPSSQLLPVQEWASNLQQTVETVFQSHPSPLQSVE